MLGLSKWDTIALDVWVQSVVENITPRDYWLNEVKSPPGSPLGVLGSPAVTAHCFCAQINMYETLDAMMECWYWGDSSDKAGVLQRLKRVKYNPTLPVHPEVQAWLIQLFSNLKGQWFGDKEASELLEYLDSRPEYIHEDTLSPILNHLGVLGMFPDYHDHHETTGEWDVIADYLDQVEKFAPDHLMPVVSAALTNSPKK